MIYFILIVFVLIGVVAYFRLKSKPSTDNGLVGIKEDAEQENNDQQKSVK